MPKVVAKKNSRSSRPQTKNPDGPLLNRNAHAPYSTSASSSSAKKRGRPKKPPPPYPPPPPPPPPPANNPYYQKFFEDYWRKYSQGFQAPGGPNAAPPPPPPPAGAPMATHAPVGFTQMAPNQNHNNGAPLADASTEEYPIKSDRRTFVLAAPEDIKHLSEKQCYLRTRLAEIFLSEESDVKASIRGRKSRFVGQLGLRCVFCVPGMDPKNRVERAICYPTQISKFYQTAQDMQHFHFNACPAIPPKVKEIYQSLAGNMNRRRGEDKIAPKDFWVNQCKEMGIIDNIGDDGGNAGVKVKEGHSLVPRARLPEYKMELFMPPSKEDPKEEDGEGEMAQVLAKEVKEDENNKRGFDKLVSDLADKDKGGEKADDANAEKDEGDDEEVDVNNDGDENAEEDPMEIDAAELAENEESDANDDDAVEELDDNEEGDENDDDAVEELDDNEEGDENDDDAVEENDDNEEGDENDDDAAEENDDNQEENEKFDDAFEENEEEDEEVDDASEETDDGESC